MDGPPAPASGTPYPGGQCNGGQVIKLGADAVCDLVASGPSSQSRIAHFVA